MKKLSITSFLFLISFLFSSCDQIIETIEDATGTIINYFVDIESSGTEGTENTEFVFTANTNDTVDQWIIDGAIIPAENVRTAISEDLVYSFSSGSHTIGVLTNNGATDEVEIIVSSVETVFNLSYVPGENTTEIYLDYPLLAIDSIEYNIETTGSLDITKTENQNIVNLEIAVEHSDSFVFINNNAMEVYEISLSAVTISQMVSLIEMWFPERYEEPEPIIPDYSDTVFSLSGHSESASDPIGIFEEYAVIDGVDQLYIDSAVYMDDIRRVIIPIGYDSSDSFLFINLNMQNFFGIDLSDMSYNELIISADILNRYPEEGILELMEVY